VRRLCFCLMFFVVAGSSTAETSRVYYQGAGDLASDFDGDGDVTFSDFLAFAEQFGQVTDEADFDPVFDLDFDGTVGFGDFLQFADAFGTRGQPQLFPDYLLYVVDGGTSLIDVFQLNTHLHQEFLPFRSPTGIVVSADQQRVYVTEQFGLFVLNTNHEVLLSLPTGALGRVALSSDERFVYLGEQQNDLIRVIDLELQIAIDTVAVGNNPADLGLAPGGRWLYVLNATDISVVDLSQPAEVLRVNVSGVPGSIEISADGRFAYYSVVNRGAVGVLDVATNQIVGEIAIDAPGATDLKLSIDGRRLYVNAGTSLVEIDTERNLVVRSLRVGEATSALGLTPDGVWAYVGTLESAIFRPVVAVVDLAAWEVVGRIQGLSFPVEIGFRQTNLQAN